MADIEELLESKEDLKEALAEARFQINNSKKELTTLEKIVKSKFGTTNPVVLKRKLRELEKSLRLSSKDLEKNEIYQNK